MLKNGRPLTCEAGILTPDNELITDLSIIDVMKVSDWIKKNIRKSRKIYRRASSYGLKHVLQADTHVYLTNNQFKDAMLLAGYQPVDPNELNWHFKIVLLKEVNENENPFFGWVKQFKNDDTPFGDLAKDILADFNFPVIAQKDIIKEYLDSFCNACSDAISTFEEMWEVYSKES